MNFLLPTYPWIKALHLISVISWMAGMFYLPRLFVYHCATKSGTAESERFKVMEHKLMRVIINPAMLASFLFGALLVATPGVIDWHAGWWWVKLFALFLMLGFHGAMSKWRREFMEDRNRKSPRFYRMANEVPTVLMIVIVVMVIVRPF